ncbi:MAG: leucine-rich repeat domain-containing protein, partial [Alphaproteobacteria bacterium]|nr:leucine-rich repeat domain-containing protein [Alphaproteobacteria bacterium]
MFSGISFAMDNNGGDPSDSNNNGMLRKRERAADAEEPNSKKKQTENTIILNNLNANASALSLLDETSREFIELFQSLRFNSDCDEEQKEEFIKEVLEQNNPFLILQMIKKIIDNRNLSIDFGTDDDFWSYLIAALNTLDSKNYDDFLEISKIFDTTTDPWNSEHYADFVKIYNLLKNKFPCGKGVYNILKRLKDAIKLDLYPYEFKIIIKALLGTKQYIFYQIPLIGAFCNSPFYNRELFDSFIETLRSHYKSDDFKDNGFKTILDPVNVEKMLDQRHKKNIKALIHHSEQIIKTLGLEKKDIYDSECFFSLMQLLRQVDPFKYDAIIRRALKSKFSKNSFIYRYEKFNERYYLSLREYQNLISILNLIDPIYYNKFDNEVFQCAYHFTHDKGFGPDILVKILSRLQNIKGDKTKIMYTDSFIQYGDQIKKLDDYIKQLKDKMNFDDIQHIKIFLDIIEFKNHDPYYFKTNILHYIKNIGLSNVDDLHKIINTLSYSKDPNQIFNQKCFEVDPIIQDRALDNRILNMLQYIDLFPWLKKVHAIRGYFQLPDAITKVTDLEILDFSSSYDFFVPDLIGNLKNLKELHISGGISVSLPKSIGNLKNLKELSIKIKTLTSLPESIGNLENLETTFFDRCQLTSLPESIGNLINLRYLSLDGNNLTTIPASIANLRNLTYLDLQGNPYLLPRSDNPLQWGKEELRAHFGDRLEFDGPFLEPMPNKTNKMDVYSVLDKKPLRINRRVFTSNKLPDIIVDKVFNGREMLNVLEQIMADLNFYDDTKPGYLSYEMLASDFSSDAKNQNLSNLDKVFQYLAPRLTGYIRALYR